MELKYSYKVGDLSFTLVVDDADSGVHIPNSFSPFEVPATDDNDLFVLKVKREPFPELTGDNIVRFDNGELIHDVYICIGCAYELVLTDYNGHKCAMLSCNNNFSEGTVYLQGTDAECEFGLNDMLMLMYAFSSADKDTLLIHSSVVRKDGAAYLCLGKSGTGKSTHTSLWIKHLEGCDLINDDNPIVRFVDNNVIVYGSPWSGKTPCYRNVSAPVAAFLQLKQARHNKIVRANIVRSMSWILPSCSILRCDKRVFDGICDTISKILKVVPCFHMECLPDADAARMSCEIMSAHYKERIYGA